MGNAIKAVKSALEKMKLQPPASEQAVRAASGCGGRAAPGADVPRPPPACVCNPQPAAPLSSPRLGMGCVQAKDELIEKVNEYLEQKIAFADRMLVRHACDKIQVRPGVACRAGPARCVRRRTTQRASARHRPPTAATAVPTRTATPS